MQSAEAEVLVGEASAIHRARSLVLRYGWNAAAFQIINPGFSYWFSPDGEGVVGYVCVGRVRVTAGVPVCPPERLAEVAALWEADAARRQDRVCYVGATSRLLNLRNANPYTAIRIGAQPVWEPGNWHKIVSSHASLRGQINRARNKRITVEEWTSLSEIRRDALQSCLEEWLAARTLPPLHFMVEARTLDRMEGRRIFVAVQNRQVLGFLIASPVAARKGWLFEQVIRVPNAPNGVAELLIDQAVRAFAAEGAAYITLGIVPLSGEMDTSDSPLYIRLLSKWAKAHGRRFWNFAGLEGFKSKFHPDAWEPIYLLTPEPHFSPTLLFAVIRAFTREPVAHTLLQTVGSALRQEVRWLQEARSQGEFSINR